MKYIRKIPEAEMLQREYALTAEEALSRNKRIREVQAVLCGEDSRKLMIIGPCSADKEDAVLDYVTRLSKVAREVEKAILIIPRIYTAKPRTTGEGYKGMLHNPHGDNEENIWEGIIAARKLHINVIRESGLFAADEMLYPAELYYLADLLAYLAVGARSVENQEHRLLASDDNIPVGMKNPMGGSKIALVNSLCAAQRQHRLIYQGWEVKTEGNKFAHAILRGFTDNSGKNVPNYHYEDLIELHDLVVQKGISNPSVIVDCNHGNSNKKYGEQPRIASEVIGYCERNKGVNKFVKGMMIESYLEDGAQMIGQGIYGKSITDGCIGWNKTHDLLKELSGKICLLG